jgi:hypothetical protein
MGSTKYLNYNYNKRGARGYWEEYAIGNPL